MAWRSLHNLEFHEFKADFGRALKLEKVHVMNHNLEFHEFKADFGWALKLEKVSYCESQFGISQI